MKVVGITTDGQQVVTGVFDITTSIGLPLEMILEGLQKKNMVVDWIDFYQCGIKNHWKVKTIMIRIETTVEEVYGKDYCKEVMKRLKHYLNKG